MLLLELLNKLGYSVSASPDQVEIIFPNVPGSTLLRYRCTPYKLNT